MLGPAPWSTDYPEWKTVTKKMMRKYGVQQTLGGFRKPLKGRLAGYNEKGEYEVWEENPKHYKYKEVTLYNGKKVKVPDADYEDYIGSYNSFYGIDRNRSGGITNKSEGLIDLLSTVNYTHSFKPKQGHITEIAYSPLRQLMQATFWDGAVVVYLQVPKIVYSHLEALKDSTYVDKRGTHSLVGKTWWDIVRIRQTKHGGRYDFTYTSEGSTPHSMVQKTDFKEKDLDALGKNWKSYDENWDIEQKIAFLKQRGVIERKGQEKSTETINKQGYGNMKPAAARRRK